MFRMVRCLTKGAWFSETLLDRLAAAATDGGQFLHPIHNPSTPINCFINSFIIIPFSSHKKEAFGAKLRENDFFLKGTKDARQVLKGEGKKNFSSSNTNSV